MKISINLAAMILLLVSSSVLSEETLPDIEKLRNGFYVSTIDLDGRIVKRYLVDTRAQLCFSSNNVIPCENLALRKEWKSVINWVR
ncbi:MAG: hypothetical protein JSW45_03130 [Thiotrichales bacterium]|nr:MAG: hypothetical protein JSW45_03130 [Thiotrichales bacterium]